MMGRLNHDQEQFFYSFEPDDRPAPLHQDAGALYGGFLGGPLVSMVGIGLHHKICHALGGHFNLRHGET